MITVIVLGLDVSSTSTGWSILKHGRFYNRKDIDYGWIRPRSSLSMPQKLSFFRENLVELLQKERPDVVSIEDVYYFKNPKTLKLLSRFSGVAVESIRTVLSIDPYIVPVTQIRSIFKTQAKEAIFLAVKEKFSLTEWEYSTHNDVTDALAVAYYAHKMY